MDSLKHHLCVPLGLVVDNTREFLLDSLDEDDSAYETDLAVVSDSVLDFLYDSMLIGRKPTRPTVRGNKTKKIQPQIRTKTTKK